MEENKQEFDPRDLNKDGKVSVKEQLLHAADKINEAMYDAADAVKGFVSLSPEEKQARQENLNRKATDVANKASDAAKEVLDDIREGAQKLFGKKD